MKIKKFECYEDPAKCVDSMLFDSGTTIAVLNYEDDEGHDINISLEVQGEVKVIYKGNTYVYPSEFPKELIWRIKHVNFWEVYDPDNEKEEDLQVVDNNWFELFYTIDGSRENSIITESDLSYYNKEGLMKEMIYVLEDIIKEESRQCLGKIK